MGAAVRSVPASLDHLIYACPDVDAAVEHLHALVGVRATPGGRHPRFGTRNAFLALGERSTLEVLGPDTDAAPSADGPLFGVDALPSPRLLTWVAAVKDLPRIVSRARARGVPPYVIFHDATLREMARLRPTSVASLLTVKGVGARKAEDVGGIFLETIRTHGEQPQRLS